MRQIRKLCKRWYADVSNRALYFFAGILAILLVLAWWNALDLMRIVISAIAVVHVLGVAVRPIWRVEYAALMLITYPIGRVVSFLVLAVVYFLILFPIGRLRNRQFESGWHAPEDSFDDSKMYG